MPDARPDRTCGFIRGLHRAGIASIFDLPNAEDDDTISIEDLVPQEYDDAGAEADYLARRKTKDR